MLIVGQADGVGPHLPQDRHVLFNVGGVDRPALAFAILVVADALQAVGLAVQQETAIGIEAHLTNAERRRDAVEHLAIGADQVGFQPVEVGIGRAVPRMRIGQ